MTNDGWEEITQGETIPTWDYKTDKVLEGTYKGMKTNIGPNKSNIYQVEGKKGLVGIWGTSVLDTQFAQIPLDNEVKLEYLGKQKNPKTNREYHAFKIYTRAPKA